MLLKFVTFISFPVLVSGALRLAISTLLPKEIIGLLLRANAPEVAAGGGNASAAYAIIAASGRPHHLGLFALRRMALDTTSSELTDMPMAAAHGGT